MREWVYADKPSTVLGEAEWRYFEKRGTLADARARRATGAACSA